MEGLEWSWRTHTQSQFNVMQQGAGIEGDVMQIYFVLQLWQIVLFFRTTYSTNESMTRSLSTAIHKLTHTHTNQIVCLFSVTWPTWHILQACLTLSGHDDNGRLTPAPHLPLTTTTTTIVCRSSQRIFRQESLLSPGSLKCNMGAALSSIVWC